MTTLEEVKDELSRKYLGQEGIHAIGLKKKDNTIAVYFQPLNTEAQRHLLEKINEEAGGYAVRAIPSPPARLARSMPRP